MIRVQNKTNYKTVSIFTQNENDKWANTTSQHYTEDLLVSSLLVLLIQSVAKWEALFNNRIFKPISCWQRIDKNTWLNNSHITELKDQPSTSLYKRWQLTLCNYCPCVWDERFCPNYPLIVLYTSNFLHIIDLAIRTPLHPNKLQVL